MIVATEAAAKRISSTLSKRGKGIGIRVGVRTTGCSGLGYIMEYVDDVTEHDTVFETNGVQIVVDKKSIVYLDGLTIDYVKQGLNEGFEFINPNEKDRCGCGESFRV